MTIGVRKPIGKYEISLRLYLIVTVKINQETLLHFF